MDLGRFRKYPHQDLIRIVADYLLREKKISGAAYTAFSSPKAIPPFVGVDDRRHYDANVQAYRESTRLTASSQKRLAILQENLSQEKSRTFNPKLKRYDEKVVAYRNGALSLGDYLEFQESSPTNSPSAS